MTGEGARTLTPKPRDDSFVREFSALPTRRPAIMRGEGQPWFAPGRNMNVEEPIERIIFDRNSLYRNLVNCIEGTEEQLITGEQALRVLKIMEAALHSAEIGAFVDFE